MVMIYNRSGGTIPDRNKVWYLLQVRACRLKDMSYKSRHCFSSRASWLVRFTLKPNPTPKCRNAAIDQHDLHPRVNELDRFCNATTYVLCQYECRHAANVESKDNHEGKPLGDGMFVVAELWRRLLGGWSARSRCSVKSDFARVGKVEWLW